jgi:hypothetical protein
MNIKASFIKNNFPAIYFPDMRLGTYGTLSHCHFSELNCFMENLYTQQMQVLSGALRKLFQVKLPHS